MHAGSTAALPLKSELSQCSPPEMILAATSAAARASAPVDTATDIWAVGIMLLELLTGRCAQTGMHAAAPVDTDVVAAPVDTVLAPAALAKLRATASGKAAFSWEPGARGSVALLGRLRGLKGMVRMLNINSFTCYSFWLRHGVPTSKILSKYLILAPDVFLGMFVHFLGA